MRKFVLRLGFAAAVVIGLVGCPPNGGEGNGDSDPPADYKAAMRELVQNISAYAKAVDPSFLVVPQNGEALLTSDGSAKGYPSIAYVNAIDGQAREAVFYGFNEDDAATPAFERDAMLDMLDWAEGRSVEVLVVDYCTSCSRVDTCLAWNAARGYASTATCRGLDMIPPYPYPRQPFSVNADDVQSLADVRNMLYLLNPRQYATFEAYRYALNMTNFDLLVVDAFYRGRLLTAAEVQSLKTKNNGGQRLVLAYLNIGEAEDYRYYWRSNWRPGDPEWLEEPATDWPGRFYVHYWASEWRALMFGNKDAYLDKILAAGFDGVYLDGIESYRYYN